MHGNNPLVSILLPSYNHERFVQQTIRSVMAQTYQNLELIVIDDGSTDKTWDKIQELMPECEKRFSVVKAEKQSNQGITITLNRLLEKAQGEYVYLIASDDMAKPEAIEHLYNALIIDEQNVLAFCDNEIINGESERIAWDKKLRAVPLQDGYPTFWKYLTEKFKNIPAHPSQYGCYASFIQGNYIPNGFLVKKEAILKTGGYKKEAPLEDWYMHLQLSKLGKYVFVPEVLFSYRWHNSNTAQNHKHMQEMTIKTFLYEKNLVKQAGYEKWKKIFDENEFQIKVKFQIGNIIKFYKIKSICQSQKILEIFGFRFSI